ncbi:2098_t:CDS:2 [Funneliformis geosporum]|uniref:Transcription initiation factor IIE subunit beta n=1 Tax=Funneliformis geosporum TaxID=1117311 RepID=A0A9W4SBD1_9GLOM|nr:2098_t:CDS:2 [Funneliformis geosporum]
MSDLSSQSIATFKKHLASQPIYASPKITNNAASSISQGSAQRSNADPLPISKKKKPKPVYSQPSDTGVVRHTLSQLHKDRMDVPQTAKDLKTNNIADIISNKDLYNLMIKNEKIKYNSADCTFQYKEDLLNLLKERQEKVGASCGMPFRELDDCIDLSNAIQELESEGKIMVIRLMKDSSPRLLYYNDLKYNTPMDKGLLYYNDSTPMDLLPDEIDLKKSLEDAGLQTMAVLENKTRAEDRPKQRKRKQTNRKLKITNTHLENFLMPTKS